MATNADDMGIKLIVERVQENPAYKQTLEKIKASTPYERRYGLDEPMPNQFDTEQILVTELSQEEWLAVKKAVLEVK